MTLELFGKFNGSAERKQKTGDDENGAGPKHPPLPTKKASPENLFPMT